MKQVLKILFGIVVIWMVSLVIIVNNVDNRNVKLKVRLEKLKQQIEQNYSVLSNFNAWQLLPRAYYGLSADEKSSIILGYSHPPGDNGKPVELKTDLRYHIRQKIREGWKDQSFNQFVSDLIPVNRTLPDLREEWCKLQNYSDLPKFSVVVCFHNEAWSTLIRTVTSVLTRSPQTLLEEVVLVDDYSTKYHLKKQLEEYVRSTKKVALLRAHKREGLIRSRILGTKYIKSPVVVFLDSHCECNVGWVEPLLDRIKHDPSTVASPVIDHIHESTFEYIPQAIRDLRIGGFTWELRFIWTEVPKTVLKKRKNIAAPLKTPTIPGGLFAISKQFFETIGYYDEDYEIWGAENLELSFKTWMCGGSLEIVPCSRVGHIFKRSFPNKDSQWDQTFYKRNLVRLAEVWLDDYAKYFYERIGNDKGDFGYILERKALRSKLKCESFKWYLNNVYPQMEMPDNYVASGQIYSLDDYRLCFDEPPIVNLRGFINLLPCHFQGGNQFWTYTSHAAIRRDNLCLDYLQNTISLNICSISSSQVWLYNEKDRYIRHSGTKQCLSIAKYPGGYKLVPSNCSQRWLMENFNANKLAFKFRVKM